MADILETTAKEAERLLLQNGFTFARQKGSHRIYLKGEIRQVLPFHSGKTLHPKIIKQIMENILK
ncbi:type II toxin-antitoxin system HicA family toxin [Helicobacter suis]|uniref:Addiction module toxin, HicA family n=1 Tax=Helicobacter suis TaxID=104628 RepID=A0A6J4CZH2_9HELI|nr:type II toxin-antitoxin system HicA family toxin [Helicobacter suis]BCD70152.1 Addiction module toxin, HicA family [Helicobacter suis]